MIIANRKHAESALDTIERWLSVEEISAHLGVASITVYRWVERHRIPFHRIGRQLRFLASEVNTWVLSGSAATEIETKNVSRTNG